MGDIIWWVSIQHSLNVSYVLRTLQKTWCRRRVRRWFYSREGGKHHTQVIEFSISSHQSFRYLIPLDIALDLGVFLPNHIAPSNHERNARPIPITRCSINTWLVLPKTAKFMSNWERLRTSQNLGEAKEVSKWACVYPAAMDILMLAWGFTFTSPVLTVS